MPTDEEYISEEDFVFKNVGKGYLFFPSGLGYRNASSGLIPANAPLIFQLELHLVKMIDTDSDSLSDKEEVVIDASGNVTFIDTDSDGYSDHLDKDDDDDGKLTIDEVASRNGSQRSKLLRRTVFSHKTLSIDRVLCVLILKEVIFSECF